MPDYIYDPVETDPDALQQAAFDYIQSRWPNWVPEDGNLESWLIAACARMVAEARDVAADVPLAIFRYFGVKIMGVPYINATPATVGSTWVLSSNPAGRTITSGTLVSIDDADGNPVPFEVVSDRVLAAGVLTTTPTAVILQAVDEGVDANNLGGVGIEAVNMESISWVTTITLTGVTSGGANAQTDEEYAAALSELLTLMTPRPILPRDFAILARYTALQTGVQIRVLALDGYNPADATSNNERMVAIAAIDAATGANISAPLKTSIDTDLQAKREVTFVINVIDPTRTSVDVTAAVKASSGYLPADAVASAAADLTTFLSSANWGRPAGSDEVAWNQTPIVRHQDLSTIINNAVGVDYWTTLTLGLNGGAQDTSDKNLTGAAPLAQPGTISVTASP